jgi:hypothetical protein
MNDNVNKPAHYTKHKWEVIEILEEFFHSEPLLWQCGKYLFRCLYKNNLTEDLQKMIWYANRRIEKENNETRRKRKRNKIN